MSPPKNEKQNKTNNKQISTNSGLKAEFKINEASQDCPIRVLKRFLLKRRQNMDNTFLYFQT